MKTNFLGEPVKDMSDQEIADWIRASGTSVTLILTTRCLGVSSARVSRIIDGNPDLIKHLHYRARRAFEKRAKEKS